MLLQINPYLLPGTYAEAENKDRLVVVTDVANNVYDANTKLHQFHSGTNALVIYRPLIATRDKHESYATPLEVFTQKFIKV